MEENDNLKSELLLLKKITTILIDQVSILKLEIDFLKNKDGIKNEFNSNDNLADIIKQRLNTIDNFKDGINNIFNSNDKNDDRRKSILDTNDNIKEGIKHSSDAKTETKDGINHALNTVPEITPHYLKINDHSIGILRGAVKGILPPRASWTKSKHVAMEMLLIHNNGFASSDELRKITGLSIPGFAKHLPSLKRSGLIHRESYKKYALTEFGKIIMNKAYAEIDRSLF
jgi:hypothetical protein